MKKKVIVNKSQVKFKKIEFIVYSKAKHVLENINLFLSYAAEKWMYILHDKDEVRPHYHVCFWCNEEFDFTPGEFEGVLKTFYFKDVYVSGFNEKISNWIYYLLQYNPYQSSDLEQKYYSKDIISNFDIKEYIDFN